MDRPPKPTRGANRGEEEAEADQRRTGPDENQELQVPNDQDGQRTSRPDRGSEELEPVDAEKGLSRVDDHEEKTRGGSSTPTPESTTVRPVSPRESQEKESGSGRLGIDNARECGWSGPPTPYPKRMAIGHKSLRESQKEECGGERTWPGGKVRERKDETSKAAGGEATAGSENEIGRDRSEQ